MKVDEIHMSAAIRACSKGCAWEAALALLQSASHFSIGTDLWQPSAIVIAEWVYLLHWSLYCMASWCPGKTDQVIQMIILVEAS